jgi:adenosylhomocysteine nucleosidase
MPARVAIIAALPREVAALVRGVAPDARLRRQGIHLYHLADAVVVVAGMGAARVALAVEAAMAAGSITMLVSTGLAGGCSANVAAGDVAEASVVIDANTGERFLTGRTGVVLATADAIANIHEKARLAATYQATLVDMEAATVARLATAHGLAFRAIKGVSDAHDFSFEWAATAPFADKHGHFRTAAFSLYIALRPHYWGKAMQLGRDSTRALKALTRRLQAEIVASGATVD